MFNSKKNILFVFLLTLSFVVLGVVNSFSAEGPVIYKTYCVQCHGIKGNGKGINTPFMNVQPRDHSSAKEMQILPDSQIKKAITLGGLSVSKGVEMPPWGKILTEKEINELVVYLRELCNCKGAN